VLFRSTTAIVLIPSGLVVEDLDTDAEARSASALVDARANGRRLDGGEAVLDTGKALGPGLSTTLVEPDPAPHQELAPPSPPDHRPTILVEPATVTGPPVAPQPATVTESAVGDPVAGTVFGLPRRQRQAARAQPVSVGRAAASGRPANVRPPEAALALMNAYQTGTRQGRAAAGIPASAQARETAPPVDTAAPDKPPEPGPAGPPTSDPPTR
jgi:hypothetical protein